MAALPWYTVGIGGQARSGKDTLGAYLVQWLNGIGELGRWGRRGFADNVKRIVIAVVGGRNGMKESEATVSTQRPGPQGRPAGKGGRDGPAFLFDLDGTLVDSVYQHVLAWRQALEACGIELSVWRIHRRVGMSGGLMANAILRETGHQVTPEEAARLLQSHAEAYARQAGQIRPLPGARELLAYLTGAGVPWAIATSGRLESARPALEALGVGPEVPVVTRDRVEHAKPDPDLFVAAAARLGVPLRSAFVVGDSVWDLLAARRARALGVGLLSGGYGQEELERAGAYRVYQDPADLLRHLDEVGVRVSA
jgi:HAD superfamily hydrolase (TIGR01549 family)